MKTEILSLRVSRRAMGAVILKNDGLTLSDGRHLPSTPSRAVVAATTFLERLLESSRLTGVVVDSPARGGSSTTDSVLDHVGKVLASKGLAPLVVGKADVLAAYGVAALRTRGEVRTIVSGYWPELSTITGKVQPYAVDAAAAALLAECRLALSPPLP